MLVLSRHKNETVIITGTNGERITVTVVEIDRGKIRLGIEAPSGVDINRSEIQEKIDREKT